MQQKFQNIRRYSPSLIRVLWFLFQVGYRLCLLRGKKPDKSGCVNNLSAHRFVCETVWDAYNEDNGDCSINSTQVYTFSPLSFSFLAQLSSAGGEEEDREKIIKRSPNSSAVTCFNKRIRGRKKNKSWKTIKFFENKSEIFQPHSELPTEQMTWKVQTCHPFQPFLIGLNH